MEKMLKCECGSELENLELKYAECDVKNGELYVEEVWECSGCQQLVVMEFYGKLEMERTGKYKISHKRKI